MIEDQRNIERKDVLTRTSSPGSAPPNSIVPPNGESGGLTIPPPSKTPTSAGIPPPPPGAIPTPPFPMWPLPGLFPGAHNLFGRHEERRELSPGPAAARDRSKMSSGSSSDKEIPLPPLIPRDSCGDSADRDSAQNSSFDKSEADYNEKVKLGDIAGYVPAQRLEWKRYKQYTRNDIMQAIEEVRKGKSALQVSKKFNIPSRTLYDKVKKMGITTGRQQQRKSMNNTNFNYSAAFPGLPLSGLSPMSHMAGSGQGAEQALADNPYKSLIDRMKEDAVGRKRGRRESDTGDRGGEDAGDIAEHGADKEKGERKDP